MSYYKDLREYIQALDKCGKLRRIKREINKDTEAMPLVRCQFRGLPESERSAFLFENIVDVNGKKYSVPLLVGSHAASSQVYAIGMQCEPSELIEKWTRSQRNPIPPQLVKDGPVHEEVHQGDTLLEHGGLEEFPIPISTPGFDNAPYLTAAHWVTKDPGTGSRNIGNYRGMVKAKDRTGVMVMPNQHLREHWDRCKAKGIPLQAAAVIGATPNIGYVAAGKIPYGFEEYAVAGGIAGMPVELVKCLSVDLEVPANAEIVLEGEISTDTTEREAPFGEYTGYMGMNIDEPYFTIKCITHRKNPIYNAFVSQFPPSEASKLRKVGHEAPFYKFLKYDCNISSIQDIAFHEETGTSPFLVIRMNKTNDVQPWQALNAAAALHPNSGKIIVVVDTDIDSRDLDSVVWALCYRMQPHRDVRISPGKIATMDPSVMPPEEARETPRGVTGTCLLIDATRKWAYPPVSLPRKDFMENAVKIWEQEGLPPLKLKVPWFGYSLGFWSAENEEEAELALKGKHYSTGEKLAKNRKKA